SPWANAPVRVPEPPWNTNQVAVRENIGLSEVTLDVHIRRLRAEFGRVDLVTERDQHVDGQLAKPGEHARKQISRFQIELRPQSEIHARSADEVPGPWPRNLSGRSGVDWTERM